MASVLKNRAAFIVALVLALCTLYTLVFPAVSLPGRQWLLASFLLIIYAGGLYALKTRALKAPGAAKAYVLATFIVVSAVAFHETSTNIFRSDYWIILGVFTKAGGLSLRALKDISLFEMFGDVRFQPFAHILMYLRHLAFGNNVFMYHALNILLHAATGFALFLLIRRITGDVRLSYALGLIFIVLPSQFDTVAWTYHIYIIVCTLLVLASLHLSMDFASNKVFSRLAVPVALAAAAALLYEPALLVPASLFFFLAGSCLPGEGARPGASGQERWTAAIIIAIACAYLAYLAITLYGLSLKQGPAMSLEGVSASTHAAMTLKAFFKNLWESSFIKNIGVLPRVDVDDIVYVELYRLLPLDPASVFKLASAVLLLALVRVNRANRTLVVVLLAVALSYLGIISAGRALTNPPTYVPAQPRYQYLPNALFVAALGTALVHRYKDEVLRPVINVLLAAVFFWNAQGVLYGNGLVFEAMRPVDTHYRTLGGFFRSNPSARVFLSFVPSNRRLFLGSDLSVDYLFKGRTTRFVERATHVYNGATVTENPLFDPEGPGRNMGDFSIEWMHMFPGRRLAKDIVLLGSDTVRPRVSVTRDEELKVELLNASIGATDAYTFPAPRIRAPNFNGWHSISLEKNGSELCAYMNGRPLGRVRLAYPYRQWEEDGTGLLGEFYSGGGELFFVANLGIQIGLSKRGCGWYQAP